MTYAIKFTARILLTLFAFVVAYSLRRCFGIEWLRSAPEAAIILIWAALYGAISGPRPPLRAAYLVGAGADLVAVVTGKNLPISNVRVSANTEVDARLAHFSGFRRPADLRDGLSATLDAKFRTAV